MLAMAIFYGYCMDGGVAKRVFISILLCAAVGGGVAPPPTVEKNCADYQHPEHALVMRNIPPVLQATVFADGYSLTTSSVITDGEVCPGDAVVFTCVGTALATGTIHWYINTDQITTYTLTSNDNYPRDVQSKLPGVTVTIVTAQGRDGVFTFVNTTLRTVITSPIRNVGCGSLTSVNTTSLDCSTASTGSFDVEPVNQVCEVNGNAIFTCSISPELGTANVSWIVNDTSIRNQPGFTVRTSGDTSQLHVTTCQSSWNNTRVHCVATMQSRQIYSSTALLTVNTNESPSIRDHIISNWQPLIVTFLIGIGIGGAVSVLICCCCYCCCRGNKKGKWVGLQESNTHRPSPSPGPSPLSGRNAERLRQEAEEKRDALEAMNHLPDRYEYLGTTASVAMASPRDDLRASKNPPEVPAPGSRLQKYWFIVRDKERDEKMILTRAPLPKSTSFEEKHVKTLNVVLGKLYLQNPTLYRVQEILPDTSTEGYVLVITPISKHSLRDVIYENMNPLDDWVDKYENVGVPLTMVKTSLYGRQVLQGLLSLYHAGLSSHGHVQTGNIFVDGNVCQLGGYENTFLGYKPRLYRKIAIEADALTSIDVIMFGHVMYEMMTGKELLDVVPSDHDYGYIQDKESSDVLRYVFTRSKSGEFKRTIKKISGHPFFCKQVALKSAEQELVELLAGRGGEGRGGWEVRSGGAGVYEKLTAF